MRRQPVEHSSKSALVLLHGFMGAADDWDATLAHFAPEAQPSRPRIVPTLDLEAVNGAHLGVPRVAEWLLSSTTSPGTATGSPKLHLVGYSLGGRIALELAARHPERVQSLTLVASGPGIVDEQTRAQRRAQDQRRAERILEDFPRFLHEWHQLPIFAGLQRTPGAVDARIGRLLTRFRQMDAQRALAASIVRLSPGLNPPRWDILEQLRFPVTCVVGQRDSKYVGVADDMSRMLSNGRTMIVDGCSHALLEEAPEAVATAIRQTVAAAT